MSRPALPATEAKTSSRLIWATRGWSWGFRFLRSGGFFDPLPIYEVALSGLGWTLPAWRRLDETTGAAGADLAGAVALRFPDPHGRRDRAGRVIPHEFVVFPPLADEIHSLRDARKLVWPLVADEFSRRWKVTSPPPTRSGPSAARAPVSNDNPPEP